MLLRRFVASSVLAALLVSASGCAFVSAATNPKVIWAVNDPAPMTLVVRRADAAEHVASEVDRLLATTPTSDRSKWLDATALTTADAEARVTALRAHPLHKESPGARLLAAEVWAPALASVGTDAGKRTTDAAPAARTAKADDKRGGKRAEKPDAKGKFATDGARVGTTSLTSAVASGSSLLASLDPELGAGCAEILALRKDAAAAKARASVLEAERDAKGTTAARKLEIKAEITALEKSADALEKKVAPKQRELVGRAKASAAKLPEASRAHVGPALVNLRQAVDDASLAAGAAAVRYPLAVPTLLDSTKAMVPVIVADIVERETGKRPVLEGFQPGVTLEGGKVQITLNGLTAKDLGRLSVDKITVEAVDKTQAWVTHAIGLLGSISATKDTLSFEADLLDALLSGMIERLPATASAGPGTGPPLR